jgi:hypothetical protein
MTPVAIEMYCMDNPKIRCKVVQAPGSNHQCGRAGYDCLDDGKPGNVPFDPPKLGPYDVVVVRGPPIDAK